MSEFVDKDFRLRYVIYVANFFGGKQLNVYGFGEWVGPSLTGEEEEKVEETEDLEKVEKLEKTEDLEKIEGVEQGSEDKKAE